MRIKVVKLLDKSLSGDLDTPIDKYLKDKFLVEM